MQNVELDKKQIKEIPLKGIFRKEFFLKEILLKEVLLEEISLKEIIHRDIPIQIQKTLSLVLHPLDLLSPVTVAVSRAIMQITAKPPQHPVLREIRLLNEFDHAISLQN